MLIFMLSDFEIANLHKIRGKIGKKDDSSLESITFAHLLTNERECHE